MRGGAAQLGLDGRIEHPHHLGGAADDQRVVGEFLPLRHQRIGADDAEAADPRAVKHRRAHAEQRAVAHRAAMQDGMVADRDIRAHRQRDAGIGMQHRAFLDVGAGADHHRVVVAADDGAEPDADILAQGDAADHMGIRRHPVAAGLRQGRHQVVQRIDGHGRFLLPVLIPARR
jgi:hypothetical protein